MNDIFGWLVKLLVLVLLLPCLVSVGLHLAAVFAIAVLPWAIGLAVVIGLAAGIGAGLALRRRLPPRDDRFPPGEVRKIRRPRGVRTER